MKHHVRQLKLVKFKSKCIKRNLCSISESPELYWTAFIFSSLDQVFAPKYSWLQGRSCLDWKEAKCMQVAFSYYCYIEFIRFYCIKNMCHSNTQFRNST